jgi:hypothetical protein
MDLYCIPHSRTEAARHTCQIQAWIRLHTWPTIDDMCCDAERIRASMGQHPALGMPEDYWPRLFHLKLTSFPDFHLNGGHWGRVPCVLPQ